MSKGGMDLNSDALQQLVSSLDPRVPAAEQLPSNLVVVENETQAPRILKTLWILVSISTIVLAARLWTKWRIARRLFVDDWLMMLALALAFAHNAVITHAVVCGFGKHLIWLSPIGITQSVKYGVIAIGPAMLAPTAARISICFSMMFLVDTDVRMKRWPLWAVIAAQVLVNVAGVTLFYAQCGNNLSMIWSLAHFYEFFDVCLDPIAQRDYNYFLGSFNCVVDAWLAVLPAILIKHTSLSRRSKIGVGCLLCLTCLAMVAAAVKTYEAKQLNAVGDYTYELGDLIIWSSIEFNLLITCGSIPMLRSLFKRPLVPKHPYFHHHNNHNNSGSSPHTEGQELSHYKSNDTKEIGKGSVESVSGSQENIVPHHVSSTQAKSFSSSPPMAESILPDQINRTVEVEVRYEKSDAPAMHAALVGLKQGEDSNPHLTRR
ncbi:hypothetical protein KC332_g12302 [Hortaea werneckii]|uniref:Rhodopsin domain-containing protein n=2 Tax=Hortaea werneckii TaxID=91943 RepID=A0A3M7JAN5_HORWE|nr:hypothetical protein KC350_g13518 [Hortaea werneckii]OTA24367.1 hypothetical protein BTJ68_11885 [Hortaea werneckii EXF-2000]KAI6810811.1 hypothetical protein KC358_g12243 [Hortaea werneckii]KAI6821504.1 hypothetical protein KC342_g13094 [Hortaea werneckii]KAI6913765.1 hypothetical protein KC348_g12378 [Hortaea werneckii]